MRRTSLALIAVFGLVFSLASSAFAISELGYEAQMAAQVRPFYATGVDGSFEGKENVTIRYKKWENPNEIGAVVIIPGRGDPFLSFEETIYDLAQKGYSVYAMDERGQGSSDRLLSDPQKGYVTHFEDYVHDAKVFVDSVVNARPHEKRFILAHSMGGAIAASYCYHYPSDFTAAILVAPMLEIVTSPFTMWEARVIAWVEMFLGRGKEYAPTQNPYDPNETFESNKLTESKVRWENKHEILVDNKSLQLGGATNQWVTRALSAGRKIHSIADRIETPILLLTAGADQVVQIPEQAYFCKHAKRCQAVAPYSGSQHDILAERDSIRDDAMSQIFEFMSEY
jgi:lysophospholipase